LKSEIVSLMANKTQLSSPSAVQLDESTLMARIQKGDRGAYQELYERFKRPIMSYVQSWVHNRTIAEEITQDVFLKVYRYRDSYEKKSALSTWLWTIARNACLDHLRKKKEFSISEGEESEESNSPVRLEDIESPLTSAENALIENARRQSVEDCMKELSTLQRETLVLRTVDEMPYEEIAQVVQSTPSSVKSLLFRAKQALLDCIKRGGHANV
jgi:RNA polymerase sigma-70 factor (ECF subfamily)